MRSGFFFTKKAYDTQKSKKGVSCKRTENRIAKKDTDLFLILELTRITGLNFFFATTGNRENQNDNFRQHKSNN